MLLNKPSDTYHTQLVMRYEEYPDCLDDEFQYDIIGWRYICDENEELIPLEVCICEAWEACECVCGAWNRA